MRPVPQPVGTKYGVPGKMWACGHHTGVDFLAPIGTPVHSATAGTVIEASNGGGWGDAYGLHVVVSSQIGDVEYRILYAHLDTRLVRVGDVVTAGDLLGRTGRTGNVSGPHLHLEVRKSPFRYGSDVNPDIAVLIGQPKEGIVTRKAPRRKVAHFNARIKFAGGTLGDSRQGSVKAAREDYPWIDENGHSSCDSWPFNMHGAPFNPVWLKGRKLESLTSRAIRTKHPKLRTAAATFEQNADLGLSTEWEVKDLNPVASGAALTVYFNRLALAAMAAYGNDWQKHVEVKVLTNLGGGLDYAKKVLKYAHKAGFTTMILPRGKHRLQRINEPYIDFNRGGRV